MVDNNNGLVYPVSDSTKAVIGRAIEGREEEGEREFGVKTEKEHEE